MTTWTENTALGTATYAAYTTIGPVSVQLMHFPNGTGGVIYHNADNGLTNAKRTTNHDTATRLAHRLADSATREFRAAIDNITAAIDA